MEGRSDDAYLIWLGDLPPKTKLKDLRDQLKKANTLTDVFIMYEDFIAFIGSHTNEPLFMIVNEASNRSITDATMKDLQNNVKVQHIWLLLAKPNLEKKAGNSKIITGKLTKVHPFDDELMLHIAQTIRKASRQNVNFNSFDSSRERSTRDLTRNAAAFLWFQMLLTVLSHMNADDRDLDEMIEKCTELYTKQSKDEELAVIEEFRSSYKKENAIRWYTRDCFLYKLVNRALRSENIQWLYAFRTFIVDVCDAIQNLKEKSRSASGPQTLILYRAQYMTKREFAQLDAQKTKLISTNGFFSTTKDKAIAMTFLEHRPNGNDLLPLLFEIKASTALNKVNFADISSYSKFPDEKETIFALGAVFRIDSIEKVDQITNLRLVKMEATDDGFSTLQKYEDLCAHDVDESEDKVIFGRLLIDMGQFRESKNYFECLLRFITRSTDEDDLTCAPLYHNMGRAQACLGDMEEALKLMTRALHIRRRHKKLNDPDVAHTLNSIGVIEGQRGNYSIAMGKLQEAQDIFKQELDRTPNDRKANLQMAASKTNIGWICYLQGNYDQSRPLHEQALTIRQQFLSEKHPLIADTFTAIGALHHAKGEYEKATELYNYVLSMRFETLPENHPAIANSYQALGGVQLENGKYPDALKHYEKALDILKASLSHDHILIAGCEKSVGSVYLEKGDYQEALQHFEKALKISLQTLSSYHPMAGECYHCIGMVYERQGKYSETLENYNKAFERIQAALPIDHPSVAKVLSSIATLHLRKKELDTSEKFYIRSYESQKKIYENKPHPDLVLSLNNLGILCTHKSRYPEAERYFQQALSMCERCFSKNHLAISRTKFNLGELYIRSKHYSDAVKQLEEARKIRTSTLHTDGDLSLADIHISLGYALFSQGQFPEAKQHYTKSQSIYKKNGCSEDHIVVKRIAKNLQSIELALQQAEKEAHVTQ